MSRWLGWALAAPATIVVALFLLGPVGATFATTFGETEGIVTPYLTFFGSSFQRAVLFRTLEIALVTTAISVVVGFLTAYVVAQAPRRAKGLLIIAAVFPLLTGVVVRSFAWLIILGKNGSSTSCCRRSGSSASRCRCSTPRAR